MKIRDEGLNKL